MVWDLPVPNQMEVKEKLREYILGSSEVRTRCDDFNLKMNDILECLNNTPQDNFQLNSKEEFTWFDFFICSPFIIITHNKGYQTTQI